MRKISFILLALLVCAVAHAEIRLGGLFSVTGPTSFLGMPEKQTLEMLVEEVNKSGGIKGEKIKLFIYDTQGDENITINSFKRLVTVDKVIAVVGPSRTGEALAIKNLAVKYKVPLISCAASLDIVTPVSKYLYKTPQSDTQVAEKLLEYLQHKKKKNIALITEQSGYGSTGRDAVLEYAKKFNMNIVADEKFRDKDKDMTSQLSNIKAKKPDAIICWAAGAAPAIIAKNAQQLGMGDLYMTQGVASMKFIELAGDAANGIKLTAGRIVVADQLPDSDKFKKTLVKYKNDFESNFKSPVSAFGGHAYDAFILFRAAYLKSGNNSEKLAGELEKVRKLVGIAGEFNMSPTDHTGLTKDSFVIVEIKDGQFVLAN
ncbi:ABC transporter substrate-binding protein [Seleniivibrio woodruffii]|uniref:Amino acid/amide ABC transporter substrate-binding protein (HAAT family) n=1 Tax=Seleniivibrio woodruffii TaxID=1078050 RepID=A0A4R1KBX9_9BACT|nr:ABC transporter substrate-binding protein [Seleniivibrio woodruffii]TCK62015.1 amino acid/amide ABC transporter substrate-binding protein (HAAT family) [Seleniivibrio woodruffii]TVZ34868.1 amino acid/amide ABC transporter substrate-binding protein, HAAT family (TC 3.A.1.4.-) [Seleniivibrio woodruffii]